MPARHVIAATLTVVANLLLYVETCGFVVMKLQRRNEQPTLENLPDEVHSSTNVILPSPNDGHHSSYAHDPDYSYDRHSPWYMTAGIVCPVVVVVVLLCSLSLFIYKKVKNQRRGRTSQPRSSVLGCCDSSYSYRPANSSVVDDGEDDSSSGEPRAPSEQQIISNLENYRALSFAVNEWYKQYDEIKSWTFASLIYSLEPHGCDGPFVLTVPLTVDLVRDSEGKLLTKLGVWHSASLEGGARSWHYMPDVEVKIGEDNKYVDIKLPHLCFICAVAEGKFMENLIVLPFFTPQPDCNLIVLSLFFERMPETKQELDKLIERHRSVVGEDAVFSRPPMSLTVQSLVQVKCSVPDHLKHSTIVSRGSTSLCEILTAKQLMGLCGLDGETKPRVCGPHLQFVLELAKPIQQEHPLCLRLTYCDCQNRLISSHIVKFTQHQASICKQMPLLASRGMLHSLTEPSMALVSAICKPHAHAAQRGTRLCCALAAIGLPDMLVGFGVWEKLAQKWHFTSCEIVKIRQFARTYLCSETEIFLINLINRVPDITIEDLVVAAYSQQLEGIAEKIKQNAIQQRQFDVELCDKLIREEHVRRELLPSELEFEVSAQCSAYEDKSTVGPLPSTMLDDDCDRIEMVPSVYKQAVNHRLSPHDDLPTGNIISRSRGDDGNFSGSKQELSHTRTDRYEHLSKNSRAQHVDQGSEGSVIPMAPTVRRRLPDSNRSNQSRSRLVCEIPTTTYSIWNAYLGSQSSLMPDAGLSTVGPLPPTPRTSINNQECIEMTPLHRAQAASQASGGQRLCTDAVGDMGHCSTSRNDRMDSKRCQQLSSCDESNTRSISWVTVRHPMSSPGPPTIGEVHTQDGNNEDTDEHEETLEEQPLQQPLLDSPPDGDHLNQMHEIEGQLNVLNDATVINPCCIFVVSVVTTDCTDSEELLSFN